MDIIERALERLIKGPRNITSPIFVKEFSGENKQLNDMQEINNTINNRNKKDLPL